MNPDKIGKFIKELRKRDDLSQYQLADKIPISRQAVSKWERGESIPDSLTLLKLSEIFNVTINELLNGEKLKNNSIKQLETTTLSLVDENNKKSMKIKSLITAFTSSFIIILILFLGYYFVNSYNSLKLYRIVGKGKNFDILDGIMLTSQERVYLKLGKINNKKNKNIKSISLYYFLNNKKKTISKDNKEIDNILRFNIGYTTNYLFKKLSKKLYIKIKYNDNESETIKLVLKREYANSNLLFENHYSLDRPSKHNTALLEKSEAEEAPQIQYSEERQEEPIVAEPNVQTIEGMMDIAISKPDILPTLNTQLEQDNNTEENNLEDKKEVPKEDTETKLDLIKKNGIKTGSNYLYRVTVNGQEIRFMYYSLMNQVTMYIDEEVQWNYIHHAKIYKCYPSSNNKSTTQEECKSFVNDCLNQYIG